MNPNLSLFIWGNVGMGKGSWACGLGAPFLGDFGS